MSGRRRHQLRPHLPHQRSRRGNIARNRIVDLLRSHEGSWLDVDDVTGYTRWTPREVRRAITLARRIVPITEVVIECVDPLVRVHRVFVHADDCLPATLDAMRTAVLRDGPTYFPDVAHRFANMSAGDITVRVR